MTTRSRGKCAGKGPRTGLRRVKLLTTLSPWSALTSVATASSGGIGFKLFELQFRLIEQFPATLGRGGIAVMLELRDHELI